ncbi:MAG: hypothetical protein WBN37_04570 [Arenicellales bacterium]
MAKDHPRARENASFGFNAIYTRYAAPASMAKRDKKYVAIAV